MSNASEKSNSDYLRSLESISEPDRRNFYFGKTLADYHQDVAKLNLNEGVPQDIVIQFETTKNLYLYSWFVYRFFPVSEHHALTCLELALRTRFESEIPKDRYPRTNKPTLGALIKYAVDIAAIKNEAFSTWRQQTHSKARSRYKHSKIQEMIDKNLEEIEVDYDEVEVCDEDKDWNYIEVLREVLPSIRNHYAHGSSMLHNGVLHTIQVVVEIINQIYPLAKE